ncbi:site-2 protease family protein [Nocardioides panacisoli]|uniref:M50 family metallopeptidase n=1 Tax=Nocardioides panacisoli TaxID=627624 RepID=UPI001C6394D6|nr:site-2 protease family protein [Nocardioides panacisoli]QYJ05563.1 site-2 protease family protein [Nocardioides panacisoli]
MTALLYLLGVLVFAFALAASIGLHELGHMIPAKRFGGKVTQYFIGFGPTVWSTQRGETEYGLKAIPLGGYVKIVGMLPPGAGPADGAEHVGYDEDGNEVHKVRKSNTGLFTQLISDARAAEWELVQPGDEDRLFYKMSWWKKVVVMAGGPSVNIAIAFFCFLALFGLYGERTVEADEGRPVLASVSECVIPYSDEGRECRADDPASPASELGLQPGDEVVELQTLADGAVTGRYEITGWEQFRTLIRDNESGQIRIVYERDGALLGQDRTTNTTVEARPTGDTGEELVEVGFLGVSPTTQEIVTRGGPLFTLERMGEMTVRTVEALATLPVKVWDVAKAIVGVQERAADSPVSIVGGGRLAGEATAATEPSVADKAAFLVSLIAGFNLFIGLFNFVPLLPLDGGHIASALWEALRRGFARLRGRPDPGHVDAAKLLPVAYVAAAGILVMGVVLIVADFVVPISLYG